MHYKCLIMLSYCCISCTACSRQHLWLSRVLILRLSWPPPKPREAVWSHHKSQELLCHRDWCSRREEKLAENQCCVTGKDLQVGGGRTRGSKEGGIERGTRAEAEEGCFGASDGGWGEKVGWIKLKWRDKRRKLQGVEDCERDLWLWRRENGGVDRGGERHFLWLQAQLVSTLGRCKCQIFIPTLETAGGVNTAPAWVIPPHKTQPCVCARSVPTVTTSRYHIDAGCPSSFPLYFCTIFLNQWFDLSFLLFKTIYSKESNLAFVLWNCKMATWKLEVTCGIYNWAWQDPKEKL